MRKTRDAILLIQVQKDKDGIPASRVSVCLSESLP